MNPMYQRHNFAGGGGLRRKVVTHNLFEEIISLANLFLAWKEFKRGKSRKLDVQEFEFKLEDNLFQLHSELTSKTYNHSDYTAFYITDPKLRHIHKATVRDRVLHHAIFRILYSLFDHSFIYDSYSCRIGKGTHRAVKRLKAFCNKLSRNDSKNIFALKCDVKKFFDSINQLVFLSLIRRKISDPNTLWLITKLITSFSIKPNCGLPIGNVTSQLFANIYLNELDQFIKQQLQIKYYLRYCDDFVIIADRMEELVLLIDKIGEFLKNYLKLSLHPNKIIIRKYRQGIDFLGYVVRPYCITLRTNTKRRILKKVSEKNLAAYLGVLKHCQGYKIRRRLES